MRLIDADNFLERFEKMRETETDNIFATILRRALINEPTAYDIDKVVDELKEMKTINVDVGYGTICKTVRKDVAIEIVKHGCVSDDVCEWKMDNVGDSIGCRSGLHHTGYVNRTYCPYCGKKIKAVE